MGMPSKALRRAAERIPSLVWSAPVLTLISFAFVSPLQAGSWADIETLKDELKKTGTSIVEADCKEENILGFYEYEKDKKDQIVVCVNNLAKDDPDAYWEVLAHEATHVMQACTGDYALNDQYIARAYRELQTMNPTSVDEIQAYGSWNKRQEIEARWMEFQQPELVVEFLKETCKGIGN
jgi:hypothetical protein